MLRIIKIAYSYDAAGYHCRAYMEEIENPGLPHGTVFKYGNAVANADTSDSACKSAVARLIADLPECADCEVFSFGRLSGELVSAAPVIGFHGRNRCIATHAAHYVG